MNDKTEQSLADALRCTAAGGHAVIINVPGCPLMVRAVDYNTLRAQLAELSTENERLREQRNRIGLYIDRALNGGKKDDHEAGLGGRMDAIRALRAQLAEPIDMVLHCPACGMQHIDEVEELPMPMPGSSFEGSAGWANPPHRSHLCHGCGHIWRPADVPTNGVEAVKTCGKADSKLAAPTDTLRAQLAEAQRDAEVNKQINRACAELPDDFRIAIELERNAACVYLLQEDKDIGFDDPFDGVASSISAAIDAANGEPS